MKEVSSLEHREHNYIIAMCVYCECGLCSINSILYDLNKPHLQKPANTRQKTQVQRLILAVLHLTGKMTFCHFQFMQTLRTRAAEQRANKWIGV